MVAAPRERALCSIARCRRLDKRERATSVCWTRLSRVAGRPHASCCHGMLVHHHADGVLRRQWSSPSTLVATPASAALCSSFACRRSAAAERMASTSAHLSLRRQNLSRCTVNLEMPRHLITITSNLRSHGCHQRRDVATTPASAKRHRHGRRRRRDVQIGCRRRVDRHAPGKTCPCRRHDASNLFCDAVSTT